MYWTGVCFAMLRVSCSAILCLNLLPLMIENNNIAQTESKVLRLSFLCVLVPIVITLCTVSYF